MTRKLYKYEEIEMAKQLYLEGISSAREIANRINDFYYGGEHVRNERSVYYILSKLFGTTKGSSKPDVRI